MKRLNKNLLVKDLPTKEWLILHQLHGDERKAGLVLALLRGMGKAEAKEAAR